jgi:hypothetical protein
MSGEGFHQGFQLLEPQIRRGHQVALPLSFNRPSSVFRVGISSGGDLSAQQFSLWYPGLMQKRGFPIDSNRPVIGKIRFPREFLPHLWSL